MKKLLLAALVAVVAVPLAGCASTTVIEAALGETFEVPIHRAASLPSENLQLTFQEVNEDSRCPTGVECVSVGQALYTVRFTHGETGETVTFVEPGGGGQATATFLDYVVTAKLRPYPEQEADIPPEDYSVSLTVSRPPAVDAAPEEDLAAMYAAVVRRLVMRDNGNGGPALELTNLYLVYVTRDATPIDPMAVPDPHILPAPLRDKITAQLADLADSITWVASLANLPLEGIGATVAGGGAVVSLGNVHPAESGTWRLYAGLYLGNLNGTGRVYILDNADGIWQVTGDTGAVWMS